MDPKSKATFDRIVRKEAVALTKPDIKFLKARRSYLSIKEKEKFADILIPKTLYKKTK